MSSLKFKNATVITSKHKQKRIPSAPVKHNITLTMSVHKTLKCRQTRMGCLQGTLPNTHTHSDTFKLLSESDPAVEQSLYTVNIYYSHWLRKSCLA